jgi:LETM1 and EF-hand domain-containing protein 1
MKFELQQWLDLHLKNEIPSALLILSRAFAIDSDPSEALRATISSLPNSVITEVELEAKAGEPSDYKQKLEILNKQEELIAEELEAERKSEESTEESVKKEEEAQADNTLTNTQKEQLREALKVLSSDSPVGEEKQQLDALKEDRDKAKIESKTKQEPSETKSENVASSRLEAKVEKMISDLDKELEKYDTDIGSKLSMIKTNQLGQISVDQLEIALRMIRNHPDEAKLKDIVSQLDKDGDGFVFLDELVKYSEKFEEKKPEESKTQ